MLTIFTLPKPFTNKHIDIIQRNAIKSWQSLIPASEIILVGNDRGIAEMAKKFNIKHIPNVICNEFGTPLLNSAFELVNKISKTDLLVYINTDIILFEDFLQNVQKVKLKSFLLSGRRCDINIENLIDFNDENWQKKLKELIAEKGKMHEPCGMDYFVFNKNDWRNFPAFVVGRPSWDNWFIYQAKLKNIPIIDVTPLISIVHQNHNYLHCVGGDRDNNFEAKRNIELAGKYSALFTSEDAEWTLTSKGLIKKNKMRIGYLRRYFITLPAFYPRLGFFSTIISIFLSPVVLGKLIKRKIVFFLKR